MPTVVDTGQSFGDLLLEMAVRYGTAVYATDGGPAALPDANTEDYRHLVKAANRGYSRFLRRREWSFLTRPLELTLYPNGDGPYNVNGESNRYSLPSWCRSGPAGNGGWRFNDTLAAYGSITPRPYEEVLQMNRASKSSSGTPMFGGIAPMSGRSGLGNPETDFELILYPQPAAAYLIRAEFYMRSHTLSSLSQRHIAGAEHDEAIQCEGVWALYESDVNRPERDGAKAARDEAVAASIRIDVALGLGIKGRGQINDPAMAGPRTDVINHAVLRVNGVTMQL